MRVDDTLLGTAAPGMDCARAAAKAAHIADALTGRLLGSSDNASIITASTVVGT